MVKKLNAAAAPAATKSRSRKSAAAPAAAAQTGLAGVAAMAQGLLEGQLPQAVKDQAQHIWLAGMGAFSKIPAEGAKVFEALVNEGVKLQKKTQGMAEEKISEVTGKMSAMAGTVTAKAGQNWDKLEEIFEARTAKALNKLGVPTAKDVDALIKRVDALAAAVAKIDKSALKSTVKTAAKPARTPKVAVKANGLDPVAKAVKAVKAAKAPVVRRARAAKAAAAEAAASVAKTAKRVSRRAVKKVEAVAEAVAA